MRWIVIYPVNIVIQLLNNWGQGRVVQSPIKLTEDWPEF